MFNPESLSARDAKGTRSRLRRAGSAFALDRSATEKIEIPEHTPTAVK
jgi:hypothetical protein